MKCGWIVRSMVLTGLAAAFIRAPNGREADGAPRIQSADSAMEQPANPSAVDTLLKALHRLEQHRLWPAFNLEQVPVAIYDGHRTFLLRHPKPPAEFVRVSGTEPLYVAGGQYSEVRANTSVEIGGVLTATYLASAKTEPVVSAAIIAHEAFHVFQRQHYPGWQTNEQNLFTYPSDDEKNLGRARVEAMLIERAVESADLQQAECWAAAAMRLRAERFAALPADAVKYEQGVELVEGTASLVQLRAGDKTQPSITATGFAADGTRRRAYAVGRMMGLLLDRLDPGWEQRLDASKVPVLGDLLARATANARGDCSMTASEEAAQMHAAAEDVAAFVAKRDAVWREFLEAPGWSVRIQMPEGGALAPQGFDPMNVIRLGGRDVLHTRWLKAGCKGGVVEVWNRKALTHAAGDHPLFSGFNEVRVTGLPAEPVVTSKGESIDLSADGVKASFARAAVKRTDRTIAVIIMDNP